MERIDSEVEIGLLFGMKFSFGISAVLAFVTVFTNAQAQPVLKFTDYAVHVSGLNVKNSVDSLVVSEDQWRSMLSVYTQDAYAKKIIQTIAGEYKLNEDGIVFVPAFPFAPGQTYVAVFSLNAFSTHCGTQNTQLKTDKYQLSFSVPIGPGHTTFIESVIPESETLPENLLRMYIHFSSAMMPGEAYDHVSLMREDGTKIEKAFLIVDQELWDSERKRFTLLFDPGRIKRELRSNIDLGPPLRAGEKYLLVIDSAWRDVNGNALGRSVTKSFSVTGATRSKVSATDWKVITPLAGTLGDLVITFDRPMDRALALKYISIFSGSVIVQGEVVMTDDITWRFTPSEPWDAHAYEISISPLLEDVAGNNLNNPFDLDLSNEKRTNSTEPVKLPLSIDSVAR